jgi:hypothetical protein
MTVRQLTPTSLITSPGSTTPVLVPAARAGSFPNAVDVIKLRPRSDGPRSTGRQHRRGSWMRVPWPWLMLICAAQVLLARTTRGVSTAFEDEGLYIFMGHRMIDHFLHGVFLPEYPGAYFSGAPGVYPVLAAVADDIGGLQAVRDLSLLFVMVATVGTYGLASQLFGRFAGVLAAASFAVCGSVIYQSQWATYDAMMMALMVLGAWLAVWSARRDGLLWAPAVAALLALAVLTKYAGAVYVPVIAALVVADQWAVRRWVIARRAAFMVLSTIGMTYFVLMLWGRDLLAGIAQTTTDRLIIQVTPRTELVRDVVLWSGPWLGLAVLGAVVLMWRERGRALTALVLIAAALIGPAQQVRIGELTSLAKHLAFGIVFVAPLIGYLLARLVRAKWWLTAVPVALVIAALTAHGLHFASLFRTGYASQAQLQPVLVRAIADNPGRPILGEQPSPQRYALRTGTSPKQWNDTYEFSYAGLSGAEAYRRAIRDHYFGVIYLSFSTANAQPISDSLGAAQGADRYYHLVGKVPRYIRGERIGDWLVWAPQTVHLTPID